MDRQTLSNYGWIVILTLVLSCLLAMATPFGTFVGDAVVNVANGFYELNTKATDEDNIKNKEQEWMDKLNGDCSHKNTAISNKVITTCTTDGYTGDEICNVCGDVIKKGAVEAKYNHPQVELKNATSTYTGDIVCKLCGVVLSAGKTIGTVTDGTVVSLGDYKYTYYSDYDGWRVSLNTSKTKTEYGPILPSIANKETKNIYNLFYSCTNMLVTPYIPDSVTNMKMTFQGCTSLKKITNLSKSATDISYMCEGAISLEEIPTFEYCTNLKTTEKAFQNCENLKTYENSKEEDGCFKNYKLPDSIENMHSMFDSCESIKKPPQFPSSATNVMFTYSYCTSLNDVSYLIIPEGATELNGLFSHCTALVDATGLYMGQNVKSLSSTFSNCTALTKAYAPENATNLYSTFIDICKTSPSTIEVFLPCDQTNTSHNWLRNGNVVKVSFYHRSDCDGTCRATNTVDRYPR